jgi:hypothetical protein
VAGRVAEEARQRPLLACRLEGFVRSVAFLQATAVEKYTMSSNYHAGSQIHQAYICKISLDANYTTINLQAFLIVTFSIECGNSYASPSYEYI